MDPASSGLAPQDLSDARHVAERFFQAVTGGDEAAARALLVLREGEKMDLASMKGSIATYDLGEAKAEGQQVVVVATVTAPAGQEAPPPVPLVIERVEGAWKIDMSASMNRMLGVNLEDLVKTMAEGLGDAMAKGFEAVAEGLSSLSPPPEPPEPGSKPAENPGSKRGL